MRYRDRNHLLVIKIGIVDEQAEQQEVYMELLLDGTLQKRMDK